VPPSITGGKNGVSTEKLEALLGDSVSSPLFSDTEKVALEYADAITDTRRDVDDELFARPPPWSSPPSSSTP
jgi:hypothetical protein